MGDKYNQPDIATPDVAPELPKHADATALKPTQLADLAYARYSTDPSEANVHESP